MLLLFAIFLVFATIDIADLWLLIVLLTSSFYSVGVVYYGYLFNCLLTVCFVVSACKLVVCGGLLLGLGCFAGRFWFAGVCLRGGCGVGWC